MSGKGFAKQVIIKTTTPQSKCFLAWASIVNQINGKGIHAKAIHKGRIFVFHPAAQRLQPLSHGHG